ncbi:MAG: histidine kinase [Acidobacteria bacterium]|nr:histidine kinase [Acidobacteriota bacterium]
MSPINKRNLVWIVLATMALWTVFGLLAAAQSYAMTADERAMFPLRGILYRTLVNSTLKGVLMIPIILLILALHSRLRTWPRRIAVYFVFLVVFVVAHAATRPLVVPFAAYNPATNARVNVAAYGEKFVITLRSYFIEDAWGFCCITFLVLAWQYSENVRARALCEERLQARLARAELQVLKLQLQPHFLFNTLNTIYNLAPDNSRKAQLMIARLSNLLRLSLDHVSTDMVPLQKELEFVDTYLDIERTRLEERLGVERHIDPEALTAAVPAMLLQPIVENAIRHGISKRAQGGTLTIHITRAGDRLRVKVTNEGHPANGEDSSSGIGLASTRARLTRAFADDYVFTLSPLPNGAEVLIDIPFQSIAADVEQEELA